MDATAAELVEERDTAVAFLGVWLEPAQQHLDSLKTPDARLWWSTPPAPPLLCACVWVGAYGCKVAFVCQTMWIWLLFKITKMCHTFDYIWLGKFKSKAVVRHDAQVSLTISIQYTETPLYRLKLSPLFFPFIDYYMDPFYS